MNSELLAEAWQEATARLAESAGQTGANAIVGFRFVSSMIRGGSDILANGTAVRIE